MIGDNYEADILGALSIGMEALCFQLSQRRVKTSYKSDRKPKRHQKLPIINTYICHPKVTLNKS